MNGALIVGALIGFMVALLVVVTIVVLSFKFDGTINVKYDTQNEGPYFSLEIDDPKDIEKHAYVIFKVKVIKFK